jgi:ribosomal protein S18 acetylase RimI-like enzyme
MSIEIRRMTIEDYDGVYALWTNTEGMGLHSFEDSREGLEKFLGRNPGLSFVAADKQSIIGAMLAGHDGRKGYIYHTAVDKARRGRGIGRRLVEAATQALLQEGITKLGLLVYAQNGVGNAFWTGSGWTKRGDVNYYSMYLDGKG